MKFRVYPKINLCLKVFNEVDCGKHKIDSIFYLYKNIFDTITIKKSSKLLIKYKHNFTNINIEDCLIKKSLLYLQNKYGLDVNYKIKVKKRIPIACGIGGGSADAAAIINYLIKQNPQLNIKLDLKEIASQLGSDIPFFLTGYSTARVTSIGDFVSKILDIHPQINITIPKIKSNTKIVFDLLSSDPDYESKVDVQQIIDSYLYKQHFNNVVYNDLTKYIIQNCKELQQVIESQPGKTFFTGSGSAVVTLKE